LGTSPKRGKTQTKKNNTGSVTEQTRTKPDGRSRLRIQLVVRRGSREKAKL